MRVDIISIFPEYFAPLDVSLIGKARERGILDIRLHQLRDWTHDVHRPWTTRRTAAGRAW